MKPGTKSKSLSKFEQKVERADRVSRRVITVGGYGIIISIILILVFLVYQSLPLAQNAKIEKWLSIPGSNVSNRVLLTGVDSYLEVFYEIDQSGKVIFYNMVRNEIIKQEQIPLIGNEKIISASKGDLNKELFAVGTDSGRIISGLIDMFPVYKDGGRIIEARFSLEDSWQAPAVADTIPNHIERLVFGRNEDDISIWAYVAHDGFLRARIYDPETDEDNIFEFSDDLSGKEVVALAMSNNTENLVVALENNDLYWFDISDLEEINLRDRWSDDKKVSSINYLLGDEALVLGGADGSISVWFPIRTPANIFKFRKVHDFKQHSASVTQIYVSSRNRNFLTIDGKGSAKLHYSTTGTTEIEFKPADFPISAATFSPKSNALVVVDEQKQFSFFNLINPHPESDLTSLFGQVWYEGYSEKEFVWQSTGGSDEFESKLSLIPLIFGTFKGTLFAMLFSVPLAILAAIYVSQFSPGQLARVIKPTVEIMAALPSVVIGFLAGLYFSPLFETYLPTVFTFVIVLPVFFLIAFWLWQKIPDNVTSRLPGAVEILFAIPVGIAALLFSLAFGGIMEQILFNGNFQQWIYTNFDITYETRNSIVVGFALGFAVIPIIFTVSEDALSNVPESLTSASLALGASRWQTVRRIVVPAASGGIFAAIMLGLGRAVGETMIVLMATGNTPIIDLNPFNGFRAMSACIAVEIPEAPVGGTLYRVLFLTGLLLFIFTFVVNTLSSLIGDRLRKKYARF